MTDARRVIAKTTRSSIATRTRGRSYGPTRIGTGSNRIYPGNSISREGVSKLSNPEPLKVWGPEQMSYGSAETGFQVLNLTLSRVSANLMRLNYPETKYKS